jgi:hypothetical protein
MNILALGIGNLGVPDLNSFFSAPAELSAAAESFLKQSELKVIDL